MSTADACATSELDLAFIDEYLGSVAFDPYLDALAGTRGEELRAPRADLASLPAVGDPRPSRCDQAGRALKAFLAALFDPRPRLSARR
jgi:hypothetical protein